MRKILVITGLLFISTYCSSQSYSEDNKKFAYGNYLYEISTKETDDQYAYKAFIHIFNSVNKENNLISSIEIPNTKYDADMITFGEYVNKKKKYVLLRDRYSFYIFNLYNHKLLGPYSPKFYGIGQDAQSGMIADLQIIYSGRFLIGYNVDSGPFLYDLTHLYQAKEIIPATFPLFSENRVYIMQQLDNKGKQFGIFLSNSSWECKHRFLFKNKVIEIPKHPELDYSMELEEQGFESEFPSTDSRYTILKEKLSEKKFQFLVFDNYFGKEIQISDSLRSGNLHKLKGYLNSL